MKIDLHEVGIKFRYKFIFNSYNHLIPWECYKSLANTCFFNKKIPRNRNPIIINLYIPRNIIPDGMSLQYLKPMPECPLGF